MSAPKLSAKISDIKPAKPSFKARLIKAATSDNAKVGYVATGFVAVCLGIHAAQVYITKRIILG